MVGALWARSRAHRSSAKTQVIKNQMVGARSGQMYLTEYFPELDVLIVFGKGAKVAFKRDSTGYHAHRGSGNPEQIATIRKDVESE